MFSIEILSLQMFWSTRIALSSYVILDSRVRLLALKVQLWFYQALILKMIWAVLKKRLAKLSHLKSKTMAVAVAVIASNLLRSSKLRWQLDLRKKSKSQMLDAWVHQVTRKLKPSKRTSCVLNLSKPKMQEGTWNANWPATLLHVGTEHLKSFYSKRTTAQVSIFGLQAAFLLSCSAWWRKTLQLLWTDSLCSLENHASHCHPQKTRQKTEKDFLFRQTTNCRLSSRLLAPHLSQTRVSWLTARP